MMFNYKVSNGLHCHIRKVIKETKQREAAIKIQKEIEEDINKVGRENLLSKMRKVNFDNVFSSIRENKIFRKANKMLEGKGSILVKIAFISIFTIVANPFIPSVFASDAVQQTVVTINTKMREFFKIVHTIGGWAFIGLAIKEIIENMVRGNKDSILTIIIKYIIGFISLLLLPSIFNWIKVLILG